MTFLRLDSFGKKHYQVGAKRTRMLEAFEEACIALAIEEMRVPRDDDALTMWSARHDRAKSQLTYSIGKLENKAMNSKRAATRMKKEIDAYRERRGEVDGTPTT